MRKKSKKRIYLDYAASTPISAPALRVLIETTKQFPGNPSGLHKEGIEAKKVLNESRSEVARIFDAHPDEIIFTNGGTESDNMTILGVVYAALADKKFKNSKPHIVTTNIEHSAVLETCRWIEKKKLATVTYVPVNKEGLVDPREIRKAIRPETVLVSVHYANNEIGTIQPIMEIAKEIRHHKKVQSLKLKEKSQPRNAFDFRLSTFSYPLFHSDAAQAIQYLLIRVPKLGVDLLSCNCSKIYGPKGVGMLYKKRNIPFEKITHGGNQEWGMRAGTENLPAIASFAAALGEVRERSDKESPRLIALRDRLIKELKKTFPNVRINGTMENHLPNNINISFPNILSEQLVLELDARGIAVSSKSACKGDDPDESYVLDALYGKDSGRASGRVSIDSTRHDSAESGAHIPRMILGESHDFAKSESGSIRISLGRDTTWSDCVTLLKELKKIIFKLQNTHKQFN